MGKVMAWAGRVVLVSALVVSLGFGTQQVLGLGAQQGPDTEFICDQYCPDEEELCADCCRDFPPATGGQCSGSACMCEL